MNHWKSLREQQAPVRVKVIFEMYVKILKRILGIILVGIGIVGIFVPIIQGILLILAGLFLLEIKVEDIKKWFKKLEF